MGAAAARPDGEFGGVEKIYSSFVTAKKTARFQGATLAAHFLLR